MYVYIHTAIEGREVALHRDAGGDPESAAEAIMGDRLESPAAFRGRGRGRPRHHEGRAHVEGREGGRARALHLGFNVIIHRHRDHQHHHS